MNLRYPCLVLDHDDTTVDSTAVIHYPAYLEALRILRPDFPPLSLNDFYRIHIDPGFFAYLRDELKLNPEEFKLELDIWRKFTKERIPEFFPGMFAFLQKYRAYGGIIAVSSHSEAEIIERDYQANDDNFLPDIIFGWDESESKRKPDPYPVRTIMNKFHLRPEQILIVDDLKWGILMGKATGSATAAAGWGHRVPEVESYMRENCDYFFEKVEELKDYLL